MSNIYDRVVSNDLYNKYNKYLSYKYNKYGQYTIQ